MSLFVYLIFLFWQFFLGQVVILDYKSIICPGKTFVMHLQAIIEEITLKTLICLVDKKTGEKTPRPRFVKQDQIAICRFAADDIICMETFKDHPQLGRFTLRDEGTLALFFFLTKNVSLMSNFLRFSNRAQSHIFLPLTKEFIR